MTELEYDAMTDPDLDRALADVEAAIDYRLRNLEVTCPGEHEYEPNCTHGANNDPVLKGLRAAAAAVRRLQGERDAEREAWAALRAENDKMFSALATAEVHAKGHSLNVLSLMKFNDQLKEEIAALREQVAERESVCNDSYDALEYFRCAWRRCSTTSSRHGEALRTEVFRLQAEVAALREQLAAANERWERLMAGLKTGGLPTDLPINAHDNALRYVKTLMATLEAEARQKGTP